MAIENFRAIDGIDPETQAHFRFITSVKGTKGLHTHDFFELFLIVKGRVVHCINGEKQLLEENSLVFIRENDYHSYELAAESDCQFINLSYYREMMDSIFNFLGEGFQRNQLFESKLPPMILLSKHEKTYIQQRLENLNLIPSSSKSLIRTAVLVLLVELYSRYIIKPHRMYSNKQPSWLNDLCSQMNEKENFVEGIPALLRISSKTHSHLCRVFKKYLKTTPVEFINNRRMSYAENLLINTDMDIIDICMEIGFENLGHFYELFYKNFKMTPYKFRKERQLNSFPIGVL